MNCTRVILGTETSHSTQVFYANVFNHSPILPKLHLKTGPLRGKRDGSHPIKDLKNKNIKIKRVKKPELSESVILPPEEPSSRPSFSYS